MSYKVLIVGSGQTAEALSKKIDAEIFVSSKEDIRDDDVTGLLKFVLEKNIDLTIPISEKALKSDIVSFFQVNGQNIFGPQKQACNFMFNKITQKKFLYKLHAQTPKFGAFNKLQILQDYLKNSDFPIIIYNSDSPIERLVCPTIKTAQNYIDDLCYRGVNEFLVEEYVYGNSFTIYYITDGCCVLPITSVHNYKKEQNYTNIGCFVPNFRISQVIFERVGNIVKNIFSSIDNNNLSYLGIIGLEGGVAGEDTFYVNNIVPFFSDCDAEAVLNLVDDDLLKIFNSCVNGSFSDEYTLINTNNLSSISEYKNGRFYTQTAATLTRARMLLNEDFYYL